MIPAPLPSTTEPDQEVAAAVRVLHRRHGSGLMAATCIIAFALADGAYASAQQQGTPPPAWFAAIVVALAGLSVIGIVAAVVDTLLLRRRPPEVRAQAATLAARHPVRSRPHHYPPRHLLLWTLCWIGMLLIVVVAVVSVPAVLDGIAYLAGTDRTVTFDPVSYQTSCGQYSCQTATSGILLTGAPGTQVTWPAVVPLNKPFPIPEPPWRWGLGAALINSDGIAVAAILISLLIEAAAVVVAVYLVRLVRNWMRHRQQRSAASSP